jgi:uncharacterized protein
MPTAIDPNADRLVKRLATLPGCLVAFSGGVDSAVVAKAAHLALGSRAIAITGLSDSLAQGELEIAQRVAAAIGIRHEVVNTNELADDSYLRNAPDRCFHCKTELYRQLGRQSAARGNLRVVNGANADDVSDFRPGMQAAADFEVLSPLAECGLGKKAVRDLAQYWGLEVWDKPAMPCLSSRVAYGLAITPERLGRIDAAERLLRELKLGTVRVRYHENDLARLEVPLDQLARLCDEAIRHRVVERLQELGFRYVTLDLQGFRSGSFKQLVPLDQLQRFA